MQRDRQRFRQGYTQDGHIQDSLPVTQRWMFNRVRLASLLLLMTTVSCVDIEGPAPAPIAATDVFSEFRFTTDAMIITPDETLQTAFVATSAAGSPIPVDLRKVQWQSGDSVRVFVDSIGRITAKALITNAVEVTAAYTHGTTTRRATLQVYVTSDEISATSLKLVALDSTRIGGGLGAPLPRVRLDLYQDTTRVGTGVKLPVVVPTPYVATYVATGGPDQEPIYTIKNGGSGLGTFWMRASVNLHGTEVRDSLRFTGTYPFNVGGMSFSVDEAGNLIWDGDTLMRQQPCAFTRIFNATSRSLEVVFSDSLASTNDCTPAEVDVRVKNVYWFPIFGWIDQVGGNLLLPPMTIAIRRSATRGMVTWFARDPMTKEHLPFAGKYSSIHIE